MLGWTPRGGDVSPTGKYLRLHILVQQLAQHYHHRPHHHQQQQQQQQWLCLAPVNAKTVSKPLPNGASLEANEPSADSIRLLSLSQVASVAATLPHVLASCNDQPGSRMSGALWALGLAPTPSNAASLQLPPSCVVDGPREGGECPRILVTGCDSPGAALNDERRGGGPRALPSICAVQEPSRVATLALNDTLPVESCISP
jgi:hypothetical protein